MVLLRTEKKIYHWLLLCLLDPQFDINRKNGIFVHHRDKRGKSCAESPKIYSQIHRQVLIHPTLALLPRRLQNKDKRQVYEITKSFKASGICIATKTENMLRAMKDVCQEKKLISKTT